MADLDINQPIVGEDRKATPYFEDYLYTGNDEDWIAPTLLNSWVNFGSPHAEAGYKKLNGVVYIQGLIKDGTATGGTDLFILPEGYRPLARQIVNTVSNSSLGMFDILSDGTVEVRTANNAWLSIRCNFIAEQ